MDAHINNYIQDLSEEAVGELCSRVRRAYDIVTGLSYGDSAYGAEGEYREALVFDEPERIANYGDTQVFVPLTKDLEAKEVHDAMLKLFAAATTAHDVLANYLNEMEMHLEWTEMEDDDE